MKKMITMAVVALLGVTAVQAQVRDTVRGRGYKTERRQEMRKDLNLTADQKAAMEVNREKFKTEIKAINEDKSLTPDQMQERRRAAQRTLMERNQSILTPEQRTQMQQHRKEWKEDRKGDKKGRGYGKGRDRVERKEKAGALKKELALTPDQEAKMKTVNADFKQKAQAVKKNESLTDAQRKENLRTLHEERKNQMQALLTQEQKDRAKAYRKEHRPARSKR